MYVDAFIVFGKPINNTGKLFPRVKATTIPLQKHK